MSRNRRNCVSPISRHFSKVPINRRNCGVSPKLVTMRCNRRNNEISHCYNVYRIRCNSYKLFDVTILLQPLFVVTILLHQLNVVTIWKGCNTFVKRCNNVEFKYLLLQWLRNVVTTNICCYNEWDML